MTQALEAAAARTVDHGRAAQWMAQAGIAFALEKRRVDAEHALIDVQGRTKTELIDALRNISQQLRP